MTFAVSTPEDLVNLTLMRIGYPTRVNNIFEGSRAANAALNVYAQTRDQMLFGNDWGFAERNVNATLLKQAPDSGYIPPNVWNPATNPSPPWMFEYSHPSDALKIRSVRPQPLFVIDFDPQPWVFAIENDNVFTPPQRVILTNVSGALIVYTGQVTDLTTWDVDAIEAFAAALGKRIAPVLATPDATKMAAVDEAQETQQANEERPT